MTDVQSSRDLAARVEQRLNDGTLSVSDVERLLARGKPLSLSSLVLAAGLCISYAGTALLYAVNFGELPHSAQQLTPFLFPLIALAVALFVTLRPHQRWQAEVSLGISYISLIGAIGASVGTLAEGSQSEYLGGLALGAAVVVSMLIRSLPGPSAVVSFWALALALGVTVGAFAWSVGWTEADQRWVLLALAAGGAVAGQLCVRRGITRAAGAVWALAIISACLASLVGASQGDAFQLSPWHALLTIVVVAAILLGTFMKIPELAASGGIASLAWLSLVANLVSQRPAWAVAVIGFGALLAAATILVARIQPRKKLVQR